ncbi:MAG: fibrobacter succinogenes major paralogous domain-containing protein [Fibromonadales bacterium]|nr:fibrobacter succinogenes major paralogous domain-containing protein [Fibromonadales bacterium]
MKKVINIGLAALMVFALGACGGEKTVTIGNQKWMLSNLNDASKGGKCYEDKPENCEKYGRLYTWEEATKACPSGWHLPNNAEWEALVSFAGGKNAAGGKLKAKSGWEKGGGGSDEYGFLALPGGYGKPDGSFNGVGSFGSWWSATEYSAGNADRWSMSYVGSDVIEYDNYKSILFSVRCVKD